MNTKSNTAIRLDTYYTCLRRMERQWEKYGRRCPVQIGSKEQYMRWKEGIRKVLWDVLGLDLMESCPLMARTEEVLEAEPGILREKVVIQVEPDVWMPVYVLIPQKKEKEKLSCVIAPPGHMGAGKYSVAGRWDIPAVAKMIEHFNYDYGLALARMGYVALCPDCRGFGERREEALQRDDEEAFLNSTCFQLAHMAEPLGMTVAGMLTWDLMRLLDYIEERGQWRTDDIGCVGFSGGGMQTLWLTAMDDRVKKACISGYMYGYRDALLKLNSNCSCNYVPNLWKYVDMGDIAALIAPRPLIIQSGEEDHLNGERGLANVTEQVEIIRSAYECLEKNENLIHNICQGGHCFHPSVLETFAAMEE